MKRTNRDASPLGSCRVAPVGADTGEGNRDRGDREQRTGAPSARRERVRPPRQEVDRAALDLIRRRGRDILATARRYAANLDDADELSERGTQGDATHDQARRYELLRQGAEALRQLKPQEVRALQLRAEGYSYAEICRITGWTYTKVNRALTEGRQALAIKLAGIEGGIECAKLTPRLLALLDGEASADEVAQLQLHMKTCLSCRARLRSMRTERQQRAASGPAHTAGRTSCL